MPQLSENGWLSACESGDVIIVDRFRTVMAGTTDQQGNTGLMLAAKNGHTSVARLLVGKERCIQNECGESALMFAAKEGHDETVALLAAHEMGLRDQFGKMAVDRAGSQFIADVLDVERKNDGLEMGRFVADMEQKLRVLRGIREGEKLYPKAAGQYEWEGQQMLIEGLNKLVENEAQNV